jgi:ABC-type multidrug transport system fused ATPase/permease subunit
MAALKSSSSSTKSRSHQEIQRNQYRDGKDDRYSQFFAGVIYPTIHFINNLTFVGICVVGGLINDIGNMVAFFVLISLFRCRSSKWANRQYHPIVGRGRRTDFQVLDEPELAPDPSDAITDIRHLKGEVTSTTFGSPINLMPH